MIKFPRVSELMVLESAAGFYIGRVQYESESEFQPYSRESTYYTNKEVAQHDLDTNNYVEIL